jgi:ZIP family zinc transporter
MWAIVLLLAFISGLTTLVGVLLALALGRNAGAIALGIGFSAGIMLLVSAWELLPEALQSAGPARVWTAVALGAGLVGVLHFVIPHVHLVEEHGLLDLRLARTSYLVALGLILHDFPEGIAMANAFVQSPSLGILVAAAIALHNIPEEFAMAAPAVALHRRRDLFLMACVSALAEPAGAFVGLLALRIEPQSTAFFLAFAAGAMIFVSVHELLPMAARFRKWLLFGAGLALSLPIYAWLRSILPG